MAPSRIAFGSCNNQDLEQPLWPIIQSRKPTAFVWSGDAVYADYAIFEFPNLHSRVCATPSRLQEAYSKQLANTGYQSFIKTNVTIFGTIDDHDFGCDNGDRTFKYRKEAGKRFLQFVGEDQQSSPMWQRAIEGEGVYGVKLFDFSRPKGQELVKDEDAGIDPDVFTTSNEITYSDRSVAIFVLDVRSNKTPWGSNAKLKNYRGDFLGEKQWQWFESAIRRSKARVNVVVSGLQMLSERYPDGNISEEWGKFPSATERLYNAILQEGVQSPILLSGDVHMAQLMRKDCARPGDRIRSLVEVTSSGMTHSWGTYFDESTKYHHAWYFPYVSFLSRNFMSYLHWMCPWTDIMISATDEKLELKNSRVPLNYEHGGYEGAKKGMQYSLDLNFAEMEFDWEQEEAIVRILGKDYGTKNGGIPLLSSKWSFDQLSGVAPMPLINEDIVKSVENKTLFEGSWSCIAHRGKPNTIQNLFGFSSGLVLVLIFVITTYAVLLSPCYRLIYQTKRRLKSRSSEIKSLPLKSFAK